MFRTLFFDLCRVDMDYCLGRTETVFFDGTRVSALAETWRPEQAEALGYARDLAAASREGQVVHTLILQELGFLYSPTLWNHCHPACPLVTPAWEQFEEQLVTRFQHCLNRPELTELLPARFHGERQGHHHWVNWHELRRRAWRLLRELTGDTIVRQVTDHPTPPGRRRR